MKNINKPTKPSQIVRAMINGLRAGHVEVDMATFGLMKDGICYGCAATAALCEMGFFPPDLSHSIFATLNLTKKEDFLFWRMIEGAVDSLRMGNQEDWWDSLPEKVDRPKGFQRFHLEDIDLPYLTTAHWAVNLGPYEEFATALEEMGY